MGLFIHIHTEIHIEIHIEIHKEIHIEIHIERHIEIYIFIIHTVKLKSSIIGVRDSGFWALSYNNNDAEWDERLRTMAIPAAPCEAYCFDFTSL